MGSERAASQLTLTDPHHIALAARGGSFESYQPNDSESVPGGSSVSLEQEMIKVADTQAQFQAATNLYAKAMTMMKTAIGQL
jgi:flagellar basal-body rod protein FlgB